ncbi:recombination mediator RecR [Magnetococcales bacterium HHB-1]
MHGWGLPSLERAVKALSRFPGVGEKSARRMAYYLLKQGSGDLNQLLNALEGLRGVHPCQRCFNLAEDALCMICSNPKRNQELLCVVEEPTDLWAIESSGFFEGLYHVLGGRLSPLDGMHAESLNLAALEVRLQEEGIKEVVIATNPTIEGEATAHYVAEVARSHVEKMTRLGLGIPMGGELEYLDESTVFQAFSGRRAF